MMTVRSTGPVLYASDSEGLEDPGLFRRSIFLGSGLNELMDGFDNERNHLFI